MLLKSSLIWYVDINYIKTNQITDNIFLVDLVPDNPDPHWSQISWPSCRLLAVKVRRTKLKVLLLPTSFKLAQWKTDLRVLKYLQELVKPPPHPNMEGKSYTTWRYDTFHSVLLYLLAFDDLAPTGCDWPIAQ